MNSNIVIGIEGLVGAGKTTICKALLDEIPNSIILHGGNLYRAIVYAISSNNFKTDGLKSNLKDIDIKEIMDILKVEIKLEDKETQMYVNGKCINEDTLQSKENSLAVSSVSSVANNSNLYLFGRKLIEKYKEEYNVIVSGRDLVNIYPDLDYHLFITASLEERIRRKCIQYKGEISEEEVRNNIIKRDNLQEKTGYYKKYDFTKKIDVTECNTVKEAVKKVLSNIELKK